MILDLRSDVIDGYLLKWMLAAGVSWLDYHKQQVNNMNVFPVPDGDTGENMLATISNAYKQIAHLNEDNLGIVVEKIAHGALRGARGNSGTILSMLLAGFAKSLKGAEVLDSRSFILACQTAVDHAYQEVRKGMEPVEGTILTVARESVEALRDLGHISDLKELLTEMIAAAYRSLENTPNLLPKLKEAGVVDSGGMGLVYILEGMKRFLDGQPVLLEANQTQFDLSNSGKPNWENALVPDDEEGYGYDVQFLMMGEHMDVDKVRADITAMGWSPLVHGDENLIKVHIHVFDPGIPLSYAIASAVQIDDIVVENMQLQYHDYVESRMERESTKAPVQISEGVAIIAVARGDGISKLFEEYGTARIIVGGQTMNPSTEDFVAAIESLETQDIIILPNNGNVIMAAQQAAELSSKNVRVLPSKTIQQGIVALINYFNLREAASLEEIYTEMQASISEVVSAEITTATRDASISGVTVHMGQVIGMLENKLVAAGDGIEAIALELLNLAHAADYEIVTLYYGEGVHYDNALALAERLGLDYPALQFELVRGDQPLYPYLISIE